MHLEVHALVGVAVVEVQHVAVQTDGADERPALEQREQVSEPGAVLWGKVVVLVIGVGSQVGLGGSGWVDGYLKASWLITLAP
jgi:hypothetical protein